MATVNKSSVNKFEYTEPDPFTVPVTLDVGNNYYAPEYRTRQTLHYSPQILEEIMWTLNEEYTKRGLTKPIWKRYKDNTSDYVSFQPDPNRGSHLVGTLLEWFPQYVLDIQSAIDGLIQDPKVPDTRAAYFARVFCNFTTPVMGRAWNNENKLCNGVKCPSSEDDAVNGFKTYNFLTAASGGLWPFDEDYLKNAVATLGVRPDGVTQWNTNTTDPTYPKSPISNPDANGLIGGIDTPMTAANRPTSDRKDANGDPDYDEGYGYLGHLALCIQQLRYQPPVVECWPMSVPDKDYVSNVYSNTQANLAWYFAQPIEQFQLQNWGFWLIGGKAKVENNQLTLRVYANPQVTEAQEGHCEYSAFFPPANAPCACGAGSSAWAIWWANEAAFGQVWDRLPIVTTGAANQSQKLFGPHTVLKIDCTYSENIGSNATIHEWYVMIKTARTGLGMNPWYKIMGSDTPYDDTTPLMQVLANKVPGYKNTGTDAILQLGIWVRGQTEAHWTANAVDGDTGAEIPASAADKVKCVHPDLSLIVRAVRLDEVRISGDPVSSYI